MSNKIIVSSSREYSINAYDSDEPSYSLVYLTL